MILRNLGRSGLRVSLVGLGCNNFGQRMDLESSRAVIHKALDCGITLFDTADVYGGPGGSRTACGEGYSARPKDSKLVSEVGVAIDDNKKKGASPPHIKAAPQGGRKTP